MNGYPVSIFNVFELDWRARHSSPESVCSEGDDLAFMSWGLCWYSDDLGLYPISGDAQP